MKDSRLEVIFDKLLGMFEEGRFPEAMAQTVIMRQSQDERPCRKWSLNNMLLLTLCGTTDARGFRQWREAGRQVRRGAEAIYIIAPIVVPSTLDPDDKVVIGFRPIPVFRYEDTEGEPLERGSYEPPEPPPLYEVARHFASVTYTPSGGHGILGSFNQSGRIRLYSHDVNVFFHELAHAVHASLRPLKPGQHVDQEVIAELVSCTICEIYGYGGYHRDSWHYICSYVDGDKRKVLSTVLSLMPEVDLVLGKIFALAQKDMKGEGTDGIQAEVADNNRCC